MRWQSFFDQGYLYSTFFYKQPLSVNNLKAIQNCYVFWLQQWFFQINTNPSSSRGLPYYFLHCYKYPPQYKLVSFTKILMAQNSAEKSIWLHIDCDTPWHVSLEYHLTMSWHTLFNILLTFFYRFRHQGSVIFASEILNRRHLEGERLRLPSKVRHHHNHAMSMGSCVDKVCLDKRMPFVFFVIFDQ